MYQHLFSLFAIMSLFLGGCAAKHEAQHAQKHMHWGYGVENGPVHWAELNPAYHMCGEGKNQSPVDISDTRAIEKKHIGFRYFMGGKTIVFNGHAVQVDYQPGSFITIDGHTFELKQFHLHTPSEHTVDGKSFPMEIHFVHQDKAGNLAVLSTLVKEGEANPELERLLSAFPLEKGKKKPLARLANASALMPTDVDYYRYNGSLTTPPCSEGVLWAVFKKQITASKAQIERFKAVLEGANNRPVQPINARLITQ